MTPEDEAREIVMGPHNSSAALARAIATALRAREVATLERAAEVAAKEAERYEGSVGEGQCMEITAKFIAKRILSLKDTP